MRTDVRQHGTVRTDPLLQLNLLEQRNNFEKINGKLETLTTNLAQYLLSFFRYSSIMVLEVKIRAMPDEESLKRWKELFKSSREKGSKNIQIQDNEPPSDEEGFLRLTIIDEKREIKEFVVNRVLTDVIERKRDRVFHNTA